MIKRKKTTYQAPTVMKTVTVWLETNLLQGSVVTNNTKVETAGQEVTHSDFSDATHFNTQWE